ncbi:MAG: DUF302 domain-containing protein [gamma proteobacterium symbiont of Taylorina sp.]|nr:DUF302 domain-containing protein [gamma proteobacterium symbiont of Taylorina sp.]
MKKILTVLFLSFICTYTLQAADIEKEQLEGMIVKPSSNSVSQTIDRLEQIVKSKGVTVFLKLDHAQGAKKAGNDLRPTQLLIFGNPKLGSPLMMSKQTIAIDLPLKAIAWEDAEGKVWLAYNDPAYLAGRHHLNDRAPVIAKMTKVLNKFSNFAIGK